MKPSGTIAPPFLDYLYRTGVQQVLGTYTAGVTPQKGPS